METVTEKWRKRRLEDLKEDLFDPDENELDKKVGRVGAWILIGGALGYLIWAPDY